MLSVSLRLHVDRLRSNRPALNQVQFMPFVVVVCLLFDCLFAAKYTEALEYIC